MNRPRIHKRDPHGNALLPRMYFHHGAYFLVTPAKQWIRLADNFRDAVRAYAHTVAAQSGDTVAALVNTWMDEDLPRYAANTQTDYRRMCDVIKEAFAEFTVAQVTPADVYEFCRQWVVAPEDAPPDWKAKPRTARMYRALLATIFVFGASTHWPIPILRRPPRTSSQARSAIAISLTTNSSAFSVAHSGSATASPILPAR
jgi:hypothetical protein